MEKYSLLFESVFKRKLTDDDAAGNLEKVAAAYPYFPISQFYLLLLLQKDTPGYKLQAKKTAALFNNNYWLNFQLLEAGMTNHEGAPGAAAEIIEPAVENTTVENNVTQEGEDFLTEQPGEQIAELNNKENTAAEIHEGIVAASGIVNDKEEENRIDTIAAEKPDEKLTAAVSIPENATPEEFEKHETAVAEHDSTEENETDLDHLIEIQSTIQETAGEFNEEATAITPPPIEEKEAIAETTVAESPASNTHEPLLFEPLHTSDYFASVGIKLSEEEKIADKLGKQLKSFTDWLKTMKKVHADESAIATKSPDWEASGTDSNIQKLAEKSNQENEVVTEAMADVLLQQGRRDKALEILEKLSLLNPSKNAYFAAKINQIKEK